MRRMRIERQVVPRLRDPRDPGLILPLDPRDPDIVRAKQLLRNRAETAGPTRRGE